MINVDLLHRAGEALYGADWRNKLADALKVDRRTLRRWAMGDMPIPPGVAADLARLARAHAAECLRLAADLDR